MKSESKPRMTRKMKRELEKTNTFKELLKMINSCFKDLMPRLDQVEDKRHQSYVEYETQELLYVMLMAQAMTIGTMKGVTGSFNTQVCIENFKKIFKKEELKEIPHHDTINDFLKILDPKELEKIRKYMIIEIIKRKTFEKYKFDDQWQIVVDGTGLYYFKERHCEHCLTKIHTNKKTGEEEIRYYHNVLEAKLVVGEFVFSIGTEFIENERENVTKQDCERNAFKRLSVKIKKDYPRLNICILGDSLYANGPVRKICDENKWGYIIRFKSGSASNLWEEFESIKKIQTSQGKAFEKQVIVRPKGKPEIKRSYRWVNDISYKGETLTIIELNEKVENKEKTFIYLSSKRANKNNIEKTIMTGRKRWKIENEGFNIQKNHGYNLHHLYSKDTKAMKNHYLIIQLAHMIRQLYDKGIKTARILKNSIKKESERLLTSLTSKVLTTTELLEIQTAKIQLRLE